MKKKISKHDLIQALGRSKRRRIRHGQNDQNLQQDKISAAVLVPIIDYPEGLRVLFTQRTDFLKDHAGQISFPGGKAMPSDTSLVETALRETYEEIGLSQSKITLIGELPISETLSGQGFSVTPYVGFISAPLSLNIDRHEVASIFEVPLTFLIDKDNWERHHRVWEGKRRYYYVIRYQDYYIWGLTARIIVSLATQLRQ